jgi:hypothetical protein
VGSRHGEDTLSWCLADWKESVVSSKDSIKGDSLDDEEPPVFVAKKSAGAPASRKPELKPETSSHAIPNGKPSDEDLVSMLEVDDWISEDHRASGTIAPSVMPADQLGRHHTLMRQPPRSSSLIMASLI